MTRVRQAAAVYLVSVSLVALFAPWLMPFDPNAPDIANRLQGPSFVHVLGTDSLGRDLFSRVIDGARLTLGIGVFGTLCSVLLGSITGAWAGISGPRTERFILGIIDFFYIFPSLLLAILMVLVFGQGVLGVWIAVIVSSWVGHARLVWSLTRKTAALDFVQSAYSLGQVRWQVVRMHIFPQMWGAIWISAWAQVPQNILTESFMSFIGLGLQSPFASWGTLANDGFKALQSFPYLILGPGIVLFLTLLSLQALKRENSRSTYCP